MLTETNPTHITLDNGLILKSVSTEQDVERLAEFNVFIHEEASLAGMTRAMILHHPDTRPEQWLFIEDPATGAIVSNLCLIPWEWHYDGVTLKAGEMGIVGTHPDYRGQGLIGILNDEFRRLLNEGEFDVSNIQGIPYFYRKYGYEYALPLEGGWTIESHHIPGELPQAAQGYTFRLATVDDVPLLERLYDEGQRPLAVHARREAAIWRYCLEHQADTQDGAETWIVSATDGQPAGYVRIAERGFGNSLIVAEASHLDGNAAMATLAHARQLMQDRNKPNIRLLVADSNPLVTVGRAWGAYGGDRYAWQLYIPDPVRLIRTIAPVLERRVAASPFAGLTRTQTLNLFTSMVNIRFEDGRITSIDADRKAQGVGENHIPPTLFAPLVFGWRNREELEAIYPDFATWNTTTALFDVLFPKLESFLYMQY